MSRVSYIRRRPSERGAVLITVLLLVTFMSTLAVAMMDDIRVGVLQTANVRMVNQAHWYARGAEALAEQAIVMSWRNSPGRSTLNDAWAQGPTVFPVDGGYIEGEIVDRSNCFNLNSIVETDGERRFSRREAGVSQYQRLLQALGFGEADAEGLTGALVDWIDSDTAPTNRGAEDSYYTTLPSPYRTANALIAQTTELRAMRGYVEEVYQRILPFVCVLPDAELSFLNVNTLSVDHAPLLWSVLDVDIEESAVRQVIAERPDGGYASLQNFWAHRSFAGVSISDEAKSQMSVRTRYFESRASVVLGEAFVSVTALFEQSADGSLKKISRRQDWVP